MFTSAILRLTAGRSSINLERNCNGLIYHCIRCGEITNRSFSDVLTSREDEDPDKFGTYAAPRNQYELVVPDQKDKIEEEKFEKKMSRAYNHDIKRTMEIKSLLKQRKVSEALGIFDNGEITKPDGYVYGLLIKACGETGYTKKAFKLYNEMKKRGIKPRPSVYTSLFNACSNSPWKEDTLQRANHLLNSMEDVGYEPNDINYNAMIKAFGCGGDLNRAFSLVDQMLDRRIELSSSTFAFLLQACVSDKEAGFRHAVMVWDKMLKNGVSPSVFTYNLFLRCCKECGCGKEGIDLEKLSCSDGIVQIHGGNSQRNLSMVIEEIPLINSPPSFDVKKETGVVFKKINPQISHLGSTSGNIDVNSIQESYRNEIMPSLDSNYLNPVSPQERLDTLGGCVGFLKQMSKKGIHPNIKTFTQLLEIIPSSESAEKELILALEQHNLEKDIEFCNMLMKKRSLRFDYDGAKAVLPMMTATGLMPNIMTFGILALGCKDKEETKTFIADVKGAGFRLNAEIVGSLIRSACLRSEIFLVLELMELCIQDEIRPNQQLLQHLNKFKDKIRNAVKKERVTSSVHKSSKVSERAYQIYRMRLASWLKEVDLSEAQEEHPWTQFRRHYKKQESESPEKNLT